MVLWWNSWTKHFSTTILAKFSKTEKHFKVWGKAETAKRKRCNKKLPIEKWCFEPTFQVLKVGNASWSSMILKWNFVTIVLEPPSYTLVQHSKARFQSCSDSGFYKVWSTQVLISNLYFFAKQLLLKAKIFVQTSFYLEAVFLKREKVWLVCFPNCSEKNECSLASVEFVAITHNNLHLNLFWPVSKIIHHVSTPFRFCSEWTS